MNIQKNLFNLLLICATCNNVLQAGSGFSTNKAAKHTDQAEQGCPAYDEIDPKYAQEIAIQPAPMHKHVCDNICKRLTLAPNALHVATDYPVIKQLAQHKISQGIPVTQLTTGADKSILSLALQHNDLVFLKYSLDNKIHPNEKYNVTPLSCCPVIFLAQTVLTAQLLVQYGCRLREINNQPIFLDAKNQYTLIHQAAKQEYNSSLLRFYLEHNVADPNLVAYKDEHIQWTPLICALGYIESGKKKFILHSDQENQIKKLRYLMRHGTVPLADVKIWLQKKIKQGNNSRNLALKYQAVIIAEQKKQKEDAQQIVQFFKKRSENFMPKYMWELVHEYNDQRIRSTVNAALAAPLYEPK